MNNRTSTTTSRAVRTLAQRDASKALSRVRLSREEELVLRLRHGIPAPKSTQLEYRGQSHPETAAALALMEASLLEHLRGAPEAPEELTGEALKGAIIDRLRKL